MTSAPLLRLLDLVRQDLGAQDCRLEIGGLDPEDPHFVWCRLPVGSRLVTAFEEPPKDRTTSQQRLDAWADSFEGLLSEPAGQRAKTGPAGISDRLEQELARLVALAGAVGAGIIDRQSPVIWSSFELRPKDSETPSLLEQAIARLRQDKTRRPRRAVSESSLGYVARGFGGIYSVLVVYDGPFSELRAETALGRALGRIERLVLALPPQDPSRRGRGQRLALVPPRGSKRM